MDNSLNDDNYCALLAYTRYICAYWDKPLQQGIGLLQQYRASTMGHSAPGEIIPSDNQPTRFLQRSEQTSGLAPSIARYPVAPYPPTAENLPRAQTQAPNDPSTSPYQSNQKQANNAAFSVASTPGLQSGVPGTVNPASGGVSSPQIGCLGPSNKYAEYDPLWVDRQDEVSRVALANLKSVFSFDDLFRFRVIKPQDAIVLHNIATYHRKEPGHHRWEDAPIRLTVRSYSSPSTTFVSVLTHPSARC